MLSHSARRLFGETFLEAKNAPIGSTIELFYASASKFASNKEEQIRSELNLTDPILRLDYWGMGKPKGYYIGHGRSEYFHGQHRMIIIEDVVREENYKGIPVFRIKPQPRRI